MKPTAVTPGTFAQEVLESPIPVLVDFWGPGCPPCRAMEPTVDELASELAGRAKVVKVNVRDAVDLAARYRVLSIPTFLVFSRGQVVAQLVGARAKDDLLDAVPRPEAL
jgi:thioredoxin 1